MKHFKVILELHLLYLASIFLLAWCKIASSNVDKDPCMKIKIVSRGEWSARSPWSVRRMKTPVNKVIIIHSSDAVHPLPFCHTKDQCSWLIKSIQYYYMNDKGASDVAYNFMVGGDGQIYEGTGWKTMGSHTYGFNAESIGIAFLGNYMAVEPSLEMLEAALNLIECGVIKGHLTPTREIYGHRDVTCTDSPGDKLYAVIRTWKNYKGGGMPNYECSK